MRLEKIFLTIECPSGLWLPPELKQRILFDWSHYDWFGSSLISLFHHLYCLSNWRLSILNFSGPRNDEHLNETCDDVTTYSDWKSCWRQPAVILIANFSASKSYSSFSTFCRSSQSLVFNFFLSLALLCHHFFSTWIACQSFFPSLHVELFQSEIHLKRLQKWYSKRNCPPRKEKYQSDVCTHDMKAWRENEKMGWKFFKFNKTLSLRRSIGINRNHLFEL